MTNQIEGCKRKDCFVMLLLPSGSIAHASPAFQRRSGPRGPVSRCRQPPHGGTGRVSNARNCGEIW